MGYFIKVITNLSIVMLIQFISTAAFAQSQDIVSGGQIVKIETYNGYSVAAGQLLVRFRKNATPGIVSLLRTNQNASFLREYPAINVELWDISASADLNSAIKSAESDPNVLYAEPNYLQRIISTPNDPQFDTLWGLHNTGQTGGTTDADIDAVEAWDIGTGSNDVVVGVIDTGIDSTHEDLQANIWHNPGEIPGNGIDDDGNGFIDDVYGWDFVNNDNDPFDDNGHGTHVAGTIGAKGNNGIGVVGVNWNVSLMALKFLNSGGAGSTSDAISAVLYATMMGAHLTSNSWGGGGFSLSLEAAITAADAAGILFIAAAGNGGSDNDISPSYPSSYTVPNIISVAATDHNDLKASFSNWGLTSVDLGGPGVNIHSTFPGNTYGTISGTSMATPHVSGVAALIWSLNSGLTHNQVRDHIFASVDPISALTGMTVTGGRLNAYEALLLVADPDSIPPSQINDLSTGLVKSNSVFLQWTATGDDTTSGMASNYDIRYSTSPIDSLNFESTPQFANPPDPNSAGTAESAEITGLDFNILYHFAIKALDETNNSSPISNVVFATTLGVPSIATNPDSLSDSLFTGETSTQTLWILNEGAGYLDFSFPEFSALALLNTPGIQHNDVSNYFPTLELGKGEPDQRVGNTVVLGAGGPDSSGYTWIDSDEPGGPIYDWFDISAVGTPVFMGDDDFVEVSLPFIFDFYDNPHTTVKISSNGYLTFGTDPFDFSNDPIPNVIDPNDFIAPFWDDLLPPTGGTIYYYDDAGDRFIAQYDSIWHFNGNGFYSFQVILHPSGTILFQYENMEGNLTSATIGIENPDGSDGLQVAFNTTYIHNSLAVRITSGNTDFVGVDPASGSIFEGDSMAIAVEFDPKGNVSGDYAADLVIASNDTANAEVVVPLFLHVIGVPDVAVSTDTLDFGSLFIGLEDSINLTIFNKGTDTLSVTGLTVTGTDYEMDLSPFLLIPGSRLTRIVTFTPSGAGIINETLSITSDDPDEPLVIVDFHGVGVLPPIMAVSPDSLSDSLFTGGVATRSVTISNTGVSDLIFTISVEEIANTVVSVKENSTAIGGVRGGRETRINGDLKEPDEPLLYLSYYEQFNASLQGVETQSKTLPIINERTLMLYDVYQSLLSDSTIIFYDDMESGINGWSHYSTHTNEIDQWGQTTLRSSSAITSWNVSQHSSFGSDALQSPAIDLSGVEDAMLTFNHWYNFDDCSGNPTFEPDGGIVEISIDVGSTWTQVFPVDGYPYTLDDICSNPLAFYDAYSHDGGDGSLFIPAFFDLTPFTGNDILIRFHAGWDCGNCGGNEGWYIDDVTVYSESFVGWVFVDPDSGTIPAGGSATITVTLDAFGLFGGDYAADLIVQGNDPANSSDTVLVKLHVTGVPDIALSDTSLDFGSFFIGLEDSLDLTIFNEGTDTLSVSSLIVTGTDYAMDTSPFSLGPGDSLTRGIIFTPSVAGIINETLSMASNDPDEPLIVVDFHGVGVLPPIMAVSPDSLSDSLFTGEVATHSFTISNSGVSDLIFGILVEVAETSEKLMVDMTSWSKSTEMASSEGSVSGNVRNLKSAVNNSGPDGGGGLYSITANTPHVLLLTKNGFATTTKNELISTGLFSASDIDILDSPSSISLSDLIPYDAVLVWTDGNFVDPVNIGDVLKEYVNAGGGVILSTYALSSPWAIQGGILDGNYSPFIPSSTLSVSGVIDMVGLPFPGHPIFNNIVTAPTYWWNSNYSNPPLNTGGILLASDTDGNNVVAENPTGDVVGIVAFPGFLDSGNAEAKLIFANALYYVSDPTISIDWLSFFPDSGSVPAGGSATITVTLDAFGLAGGDYAADMVISGNDPTNSSDTVLVKLHVTGAPDVAVSNDTLDFGSFFIGLEDSLDLTIFNEGTDTLSVSSLIVTGTDYAMDTSPFSLGPGDSLTRGIIFTPSVAGIINETLSMASNDPDEPLIVVDFHGVGVLPPIMAVSPDSLSDSLFTGGAATHSFTISNSGVSDLIFTISVEGVADTALSVKVNGTSNFLRPHSSQRIAIDDFTSLSTATGDAVRAGEMVAIGPQHQHPIYPVGGSSIAPMTSYSEPTYYPFSFPSSVGSVLVIADGGTQLDLIPLLTAAGYSVTEVIDDASYDGTNPAPNSFDAVVLLDGVNFGSDMPVAGQTALADYVFSGGGIILTEWIAWEVSNGRYANMSDLVPITRTSGFEGSDNLTVVLAHPVTEGVSSSFVVLNGANIGVLNSGEVVVTGSESGDAVVVKSYGDGRIVAFASAGNYFGHHPFQQVDMAKLFTNAVSWVSGVSAANWLSFEPDSETVPAGGSAIITVTLDAFGLFGGDYAADLIVQGNDPANSSDTVLVKLHVTGAPDIALSDSAVEYDTTFVGVTSSKIFMINNEGTDTLFVSDIVSDAADFSTDITSFALAVGDTQTVTVTFLPSDSGFVTGTLTIFSNDPDELEVTIDLAGVGLFPPELTVSPSVLEVFVAVGDSTSQTFTISNTGGSDLIWTSSATVDSQSTRVLTAPLLRQGLAGEVINTGTNLTLSIAKFNGSLEKITEDNKASSGTPRVIAQKVKQERISMSMGEIERITDKSVLETAVSGVNTNRKLIFNGPTIMSPITLENEVAVAVFNESGTFSQFWLKDVGINVITNPDLAYFATEIDPFISVSPDSASDPLDTDGDGYFDTFTEYWLSISNLNIQRTIHLRTGLPVVEANYSVTNIDASSHVFDFYQALDYNNGIEYIYPPNSNDDLSIGGIFPGVPYLIMQMDGGFASTVIQAPGSIYSKGGFWNPLYIDPNYDPSGDDIGDSEDGNITDNGVSVGAGIGTLNPGGNVNFQVVFLVGHTIDEANLLASGSNWLFVNLNEGLIPANGSTIVTATTDAVGLIGGEYYATIGINSNDPFNESDSVRFILHVVGIPDLTTSPNSLDYGEVFISDADTLEFAVANTGTDRSEVDSLISTHPDFTVLTGPFHLSPAETTLVIVAFVPSSDTTAFGEILLYSNDPDAPITSIFVTGIGSPDPNLNYSPIISGIPEMIFNEDEVDSSLDLDDYVVDFDTPIEDLEWSFTIEPSSLSASERAPSASADTESSHDYVRSMTSSKYSDAGVTSARTRPTVAKTTNRNEYSLEFTAGRDAGNVRSKPVVIRAKIRGTSKEEDFGAVGLAAGSGPPLVAESHGLNVSLDPETHRVTLWGDPDWFGDMVVVLNAVDNTGLTDFYEMFVSVNAVNDPPIISVEDTSFGEDEIFTMLLDTLVSDVDHAVEDMIWSAEVLAEHVNLIGVGNTLSGTSSTSVKKFIRNISSSNPQSGIRRIKDKGNIEGISGSTRSGSSKYNRKVRPQSKGAIVGGNRSSKSPSFGKFADDISNKRYNAIGKVFGGTAVDDSSINVSVDNDTRVLTITAVQDWNGSRYVVLSVVDSDGGSAVDTFLITVLPVGDSPVVDLPPGISFPEDSTHTTLDLDDYVTDVDTESSDITWAFTQKDTSSPIWIFIDASTHQVVFEAERDWNGQRIITFIAWDPDSLLSMDSLLVVVSPVNDPPDSVLLLFPAPGDTAIQNDTTNFEWHAVFDPDLDDVINYAIQFSGVDDFQPEDIEIVEVGEDTSITLTELPVSLGKTYWRVEARDLDGAKSYSEIRSFDFITHIFAEGELPSTFELAQNYPNPFNPATTIEYSLPKAANVLLVIYNLRGAEVARLVDADQQAGYKKVIWNASNVASGVYFYRLRAGDFVQTKKLVLLK